MNRQRIAIISVLALALPLAGCAAPKVSAVPPMPVPAATTQPAAIGAWIDNFVPPGQQHVFTGDRAYLAIGRAGGAMRFQIRPLLLPSPLLVLWSDIPAGPPIEHRPLWSNLVYYTIGRPYRIDLTYPKLGPEQRTTDQPRGDYGTVTYHMPSQTKTDYFVRDLVAYTSPMHLVLTLLGPLPDGRSRVLAFHKSGRDYWATIDAGPDGRRVLHFPCAMIWADWSDENLASRCTFEIDDVRDWPRTTIHTTNFTRFGPTTVKFVRTEPISD